MLVADTGERHRVTAPPADDKAPLGFKIVVVAAIAYLAVRLIQGVIWFVEWLR